MKVFLLIALAFSACLVSEGRFKQHGNPTKRWGFSSITDSVSSMADEASEAAKDAVETFSSQAADAADQLDEQTNSVLDQANDLKEEAQEIAQEGYNNVQDQDFLSKVDDIADQATDLTDNLESVHNFTEENESLIDNLVGAAAESQTLILGSAEVGSVLGGGGLNYGLAAAEVNIIDKLNEVNTKLDKVLAILQAHLPEGTIIY